MNAEAKTLILDGEPISVPSGTRLSDVVFVDMPCGAHSRCGKCKVIATGALSAMSDAEKRLLSEDEIRGGVRLACSTFVEGECEVKTYFASRGARILTDFDKREYNICPSFKKYGVAVDVGTTTLAAKLFDDKGSLLASGACLNPQSRWGADVISRIEASLSKDAKELSKAIRDAVSWLCKKLAYDAKIEPCEIEELVISGNSVMLCLLSATDLKPLSCAPFVSKRLFGEEIYAKDLEISGLSQNAIVYLPRCVGSFVGADLLCAVLASGMCSENGVSLLVDVGTNGEMAVFKDGLLTVCSTAAGPAFEGAGISCGMTAQNGAIDSVSLIGGRLIPHVIAEGEARGICGSGLVDAVACLLECEQIDNNGYLEDNPYTVSGLVSISQEDIRALQLAKSAICAGISTLLKTSDIDVSEVTRFYLAGGFGTYLNLKSAERIGLFPRGLLKSAHVIGNAALDGAVMMLLDPSLRDAGTIIAKDAKLIELSKNLDFAQTYIQEMMFR